MSSNNIPTFADEKSARKIESLEKGEKLYTVQIDHDGIKGTTVTDVKTLIFQEYENGENHIKDTGEPQRDDAIMAVLLDERFPNIPIKHQDLSIGYFLNPINALDASINLFNDIVRSLECKKSELLEKEERKEEDSCGDNN